MPKKSETPFLHLYPQLDNHIEAWVVGNRAGLKALKKAITKALQQEALEGSEVMAGDGEGYQVLVLPLSDSQFQNLPMPYTEAKHTYGGVHPYSMVTPAAYRSAMTSKNRLKKSKP